MEGTGHSRLAEVGAVVGILGGIAGILTWANITPEMVGEALYRTAYVTIPFLMTFFGIVIGWSLTRLRYESIIRQMEDEAAEESDRAEARRAEKRAVQIVQHMDMKLKIALEAVRSQIYMVVPDGRKDASDALETLHEMGLVDYETCLDGRRWFLTPASHDLLVRHPDLLKEAKRVIDEER